MQLIKQLLLVMGFVCLASGSLQAAGKGQEQVDSKGPHGGKILEQGNVTVELAIFEQGVPPEYRAWITLDGKPVTGDLQLAVELTRLGGQVDNFTFVWQDNYWQGDGVVTEPHSFDVDVILTLGGKTYQWGWESYEGRISIAPDIASAAGIKTAVAGPGAISRKITTYGVLTAAPEQVARVGARFPGLVTQVNVQLGDRVAQGDVLAEVESNESLKKYSLRAPITGVVIARLVNSGEMAGEEALYSIANLDSLWAELKVFPGQRADVRAGQTVSVTAQGLEQLGTIQHLLPTPGNSPYTLARVKIDNPEGFLSPGLMVAGDIVVDEVVVPLVVDNRALQSFRDWTVVFIQVDDSYEIRPLELGRSDGAFTEVLGGLQAGDRYVVENSYLIKADIEKSGASHDH